MTLVSNPTTFRVKVIPRCRRTPGIVKKNIHGWLSVGELSKGTNENNFWGVFPAILWWRYLGTPKKLKTILEFVEFVTD